MRRRTKPDPSGTTPDARSSILGAFRPIHSHPEWQSPHQNAISPGTRARHAQRVLELGPKRATALLKYALLTQNWPHVDWQAVQKGLPNP